MAPMSKSLAPSVVTVRDPKGMKFMDIVAAAYNKAQLQDGPVGTPEGEAQRVNEAEGLSDLIAKHIAKHRILNVFAGEEVASNYGYLSGYKSKNLHDQTNLLRKLFPGIRVASPSLLMQVENGEVELPAGAEGWFAIPNWMKCPDIFGKTYTEAVQKVLDTIKKERGGQFCNRREGLIDDKHLRQSARSVEAWKKIADAQGNPDILIVAGQFGLRHKGRSVRRAREVFAENEFGLGAFAVGCMLSTHPKRLENYDDLWIDCLGDEFSPDGDGEFSRALCFGWNGDRVGFDAGCVSIADDSFGTASGFSPQS
jgi:hypothetical protein